MKYLLLIGLLGSLVGCDREDKRDPGAPFLHLGGDVQTRALEHDLASVSSIGFAPSQQSPTESPFESKQLGNIDSNTVNH
jgi:hypothetical protein